MATLTGESLPEDATVAENGYIGDYLGQKVYVFNGSLVLSKFRQVEPKSIVFAFATRCIERIRAEGSTFHQLPYVLEPYKARIKL